MRIHQGGRNDEIYCLVGRPVALMGTGGKRLVAYDEGRIV